MSPVMARPPKKDRKTPRYPSRDTYASVVIPKALAEELRVIGEEQDRSVSYLVKRAVMAYLEAHRKQK